MTYSIVARDASSGQMGVAVQSHWFATGSVVTWGAPGVGVVATQAFAQRSYGPLGLERMRAGQSPDEALDALLAVDDQPARRQIAMLDASGRVAVHTGDGCIAEAGHLTGDGFSVQANMMLRDTVPAAMASAFSSAQGTLAHRLLAALDAAEEQGGDVRGRQSAAILVVSADPDVTMNVIDVRVDDHAAPLAELRRLVAVAGAYATMEEGDEHFARGELDQATASYEAAQAAVPDNVEFSFWLGVLLANAGRLDEARPFLARTRGAPGDWDALLRRLPANDLLSAERVEALLNDKD